MSPSTNASDTGKEHASENSVHNRGRQQGIPCFAAGTLILTPDGQRSVEDLRPGDLVQTMDSGFQRVRWTGKRSVDGHGALAPVLIPEGALTNARDLLVSPQHRMLLAGASMRLWFAEGQALVAAKSLVGTRGIRYAPVPRITYVHFMCDRHEVVFAEGAPTETLLIGPQSIADLPNDAVAEIFALFPELKEKAHLAARPLITHRLAAVL